MLKLQAVLVGSGSEEDPFTVPLPTWVMVDVDYERMEAIVAIPEDVYGEAGRWEVRKVTDSRGKEHEIIIPSRDTMDAWQAIEEEKYPHYAARRRIRDVVRGK